MAENGPDNEGQLTAGSWNVCMGRGLSCRRDTWCDRAWAPAPVLELGRRDTYRPPSAV
jgi:hypothetical protein